MAKKKTDNAQDFTIAGITFARHRIKVTLTEESLGLSPASPEIYEQFIASKAPDAPSREEEVAVMGAGEVVEKTMTVFPKMEDGTPFFWDYQFKGYLKDAAGMLKRVTGSRSSKVKAYKKELDGMIFIQPRRIPFELPEGGKTGTCQRPLRASTAQGDRTALAMSETVPAGTTLTVDILVTSEAHWQWIVELLEYGQLRGLSQWRNSGKGTFTWEEI